MLLLYVCVLYNIVFIHVISVKIWFVQTRVYIYIYTQTHTYTYIYIYTYIHTHAKTLRVFVSARRQCFVLPGGHEGARKDMLSMLSLLVVVMLSNGTSLFVGFICELAFFV